MTQHDDAIGLRHMLDYAREAAALVQNTTRDDLHANRVLSLALVRLLEIVGEGVKRLPLNLRSRYPSVPWKEIAGTRDHLSHGYDDVDYQVLWDAVQQDLPVLLATVEQMLTDLDSGKKE